MDNASAVARADTRSSIEAPYGFRLPNKPRQDLKFPLRARDPAGRATSTSPTTKVQRRPASRNAACGSPQRPQQSSAWAVSWQWIAIPEPAHPSPRPASASASRAAVCLAAELNYIDPIWNVVRRQSLSFDINNKETEVMKITTIVIATALAISTSCAFAAGSGAGGGGPGGGAAGAAGGASAGAGAGAASPGVTAPGGASSTTPGTTTGTATGSATGATTTPGQTPATPGLNANGPCNGASSTTGGGAC
jgi:hypothetical protein